MRLVIFYIFLVSINSMKKTKQLFNWSNKILPVLPSLANVMLSKIAFWPIPGNKHCHKDKGSVNEKYKHLWAKTLWPPLPHKLLVLATETSPTCWGMDSTRPRKGPQGFKVLAAHPFKSSKSRAGAAMDQACSRSSLNILSPVHSWSRLRQQGLPFWRWSNEDVWPSSLYIWPFLSQPTVTAVHLVTNKRKNMAQGFAH